MSDSLGLSDVAIHAALMGTGPEPTPGAVLWKHEATVVQAMRHTRGEVRVWPVENIKTGLIDCVVGPCDVAELYETMRVIDDPKARIEMVARWR